MTEARSFKAPPRFNGAQLRELGKGEVAGTLPPPPRASTEPSCVSWEKTISSVMPWISEARFNGAQLRELGKVGELDVGRTQLLLQRSPAA